MARASRLSPAPSRPRRTPSPPTRRLGGRGVVGNWRHRQVVVNSTGGRRDLGVRRIGTRDAAGGRPRRGRGSRPSTIVHCPYGTGPGSYRWAAAGPVHRPPGGDRCRLRRGGGPVPVPSINISPPARRRGRRRNWGSGWRSTIPVRSTPSPRSGPVWASVTARFVGMTWEMGNGDSVECDGLGTPYPEGSGTYEPGSVRVHVHPSRRRRRAPCAGGRALAGAAGHVGRREPSARPDRAGARVRLRGLRGRHGGRGMTGTARRPAFPFSRSPAPRESMREGV